MLGLHYTKGKRTNRSFNSENHKINASTPSASNKKFKNTITWLFTYMEVENLEEEEEWEEEEWDEEEEWEEEEW